MLIQNFILEAIKEGISKSYFDYQNKINNRLSFDVKFRQSNYKVENILESQLFFNPNFLLFEDEKVSKAIELLKEKIEKTQELANKTLEARKETLQLGEEISKIQKKLSRTTDSEIYLKLKEKLAALQNEFQESDNYFRALVKEGQKYLDSLKDLSPEDANYIKRIYTKILSANDTGTLEDISFEIKRFFKPILNSIQNDWEYIVDLIKDHPWISSTIFLGTTAAIGAGLYKLFKSFNSPTNIREKIRKLEEELKNAQIEKDRSKVEDLNHKIQILKDKLKKIEKS